MTLCLLLRFLLNPALFVSLWLLLSSSSFSFSPNQLLMQAHPQCVPPGLSLYLPPLQLIVFSSEGGAEPSMAEPSMFASVRAALFPFPSRWRAPSNSSIRDFISLITEERTSWACSRGRRRDTSAKPSSGLVFVSVWNCPCVVMSRDLQRFRMGPCTGLRLFPEYEQQRERERNWRNKEK